MQTTRHYLCHDEHVRVPHRQRPKIWGQAAHVSMHLVAGLPSMRQTKPYAIVVDAIRRGQERFDCRVVAFTVMSNHLHLVVEAQDNEGLARFMKGLMVAIARRTNALWKRSGRFFRDRYFVRVLETMRKLRSAFRYVLSNARKHGVPLGRDVIDPYSSGRWHPYWTERRGQRTDAAPVAWPRSILLSQIYFRMEFSINEVPGSVLY